MDVYKALMTGCMGCYFAFITSPCNNILLLDLKLCYRNKNINNVMGYTLHDKHNAEQKKTF